MCSSLEVSSVHVGTECPLEHRLWYPNSRSWGVQLVAVHNKDLIECNVCGNTCSQWDCLSPRGSRANETVIHTIPLYLSTCPFPHGLYRLVRLVATPRLLRNNFSSSDIKLVPRSECTYPDIPNKENNWTT